MLRKLAKHALRSAGVDITVMDRRMVSLKAGGVSRGNVLLSYLIDPFLGTASHIPQCHPIHWESMQIARTYLDAGYAVDIIYH
ncbi:MAG: hypothetical protein GF331_23830, partial [Chitinivibrionales bacterium]|nr:hypothetical protein [Chitinivibrionales bacterium]